MALLAAALELLSQIQEKLRAKRDKRKLEKAMDYIQKLEKKAANLKSLAVTSLNEERQVRFLLNLTQAAHDDFWRCDHEENLPEPPGRLIQQLSDLDFALATEAAQNQTKGINETSSRMRIDLILTACIAMQKRQMWGNRVEDGFSLTTEAPLGIPVRFERQNRYLNGNCDYALQYDDGKPETHLLVVEAKRRDAASAGSAIAQCLAYAGIVHKQRKKSRTNATVYGCITDSETWIFLKIHDNSEYSVHGRYASQIKGWSSQPRTIWRLLSKVIAATQSITPAYFPIKVLLLGLSPTSKRWIPLNSGIRILVSFQ